MAMIESAGARFKNPFPGLRPFTEEEEPLFFGREHQADAMIDKLCAARLLAVVGTSGSGKTSLVNCGLRPGLHRGLMASAGSSWRIVQFRPGSRPLENLICALAEDGALYRGYSGPIPVEELVETSLKLSRHGLVDAFRKARLPPGENLLIVVDQFEEVFRYRTADGKQLGAGGRNEGNGGFIDLLLEAKQQTEYPIYVVLTMRSDFLGNCAEFAGLPEALNEGQYLVPRMTRSEQRAAIEGPVRIGGAEIATVLLTRLVNDVDDNPDQLPILQHALHRTWERWASEGRAEQSLELRHYEAVGTMAHALDQHAEEAFAKLSGAGQAMRCERIFKALTDKGTDARGIRRPTKFSRLCSLAEATPAEAMEVLEVFRHPDQSFLLPPAGMPIGPDSVIDISHESLMRVWERLKAWVEEEAASAQIYRRLAEVAALHEAEAAGLWRDPDLQVALAWREKQQPNATWAEQYGGGFERSKAFLDASGELREREVEEAERRSRMELERAQREAEEQRVRAEEQRLRAEEQARSARRLRLLAFGMALCVLVAALAAVAALRSGKAARSWAEAAEAAKGELSKKISEESKALLGEQQAEKIAKSERLGALAAALDAHVAKVDAEEQTRRAQHEARRNYAHEIAAESKGLPDSQSQLKLLLGLQAVSTTYERDRSVEKEAAESLEQAIASAQPKPPAYGHVGDVLAVALSHDGSRVATAGQDGSVRIWDGSSGVCLLTMIGSGSTPPVQAVSFSADGQWVASGGTDRVVRVWSAGTGKLLRELLGHSGPVTAVAFSPAGKRLASSSEDGTVNVWDLSVASGKPRTFLVSDGAVSAVSFSADGKRLGTASKDGVAKVWDSADPDRAPQLFQPTGSLPPLNAIGFSPNGLQVATAGNDGFVRIYDLHDRVLVRQVDAQTVSIASLMYSPRGNLLVTTGTAPSTFASVASASPVIAARVWDLSDSEERYVNLYSGGSATSTNAAASRLLSSQSQPFSHAVFFSADGQRVATAGSDGSARVWDARQGQELLHLSNLGPTQRMLGASDDGRLLAAVGADARLRLFDVASGLPVVSLGRVPNVLSGSFSHGGRFLATSDFSGGLRVWDTTTGKQIRAVALRRWTPIMAVSADGKTLATADMGGKAASLRSLETGNVIASPPVNFAGAVPLLFSSDGAYLAASSGDRGLDIIETAPPNRRHSIKLTEQISSFNLSPDGKRLITASRDDQVRVWDAFSGNEAAQLQMPAHDVYGLSFNANGTAVAILSLDADGRNSDVNLWDLSKGKAENMLSLRADGLGLRMAFDAGDDLVVMDVKMTVHRYSRSMDKAMRMARARVLRGLDPEECKRYLHGSGCPTDALALADVAAANRWLSDGDANAAELSLRRAKQEDAQLQLDARQEVAVAEADALMATGTHYASTGDFARAEESYKAALLNNPEMHFNAGEASQYVAVPILVGAGQNFARNGRQAEAEANFMRAKQLDPELVLDPAKELAKWAGQNALARGLAYADAGDALNSKAAFDEAATAFSRTGLDLRQQIAGVRGGDCLPRRDSAPGADKKSDRPGPRLSDSELEASCMVSNVLFGRIARLLEAKQVAQAAGLSNSLVDLYSKVQDSDPSKGSRGQFFNDLCFQSAREGFAKPVLTACDESIKLSTEQDLPGNYDSRGLAKALNGDFKGAIEDYRYFVEHYDFRSHPEYKQQRLRWIAALCKGTSPFTPSELKTLQDQ